ncbi:MAG: hypothetical protein AAF985_13015, partial [Bacteroidota bacterium]
PKYQSFPEARTLVEQKGAFSVLDATMLGTVFSQLQSPPFYQRASQQMKAYIENNSGATVQIIGYIESIIESL